MFRRLPAAPTLDQNDRALTRLFSTSGTEYRSNRPRTWSALEIDSKADHGPDLPLDCFKTVTCGDWFSDVQSSRPTRCSGTNGGSGVTAGQSIMHKPHMRLIRSRLPADNCDVHQLQ